MTSTHLLFSVGLSGIIVPNMYLNLKKVYYSKLEEERPFATVNSNMEFNSAPGVESLEVSTSSFALSTHTKPPAQR